MSSLQETAFDYEAAVWTCQLLPYRIIACRDRIQYIVQRREETMYRKRSLDPTFCDLRISASPLAL